MTASTIELGIDFASDLSTAVIRASRDFEAAPSPVRLATQAATILREVATMMEDMRHDVEKRLSDGLPRQIIVRDFPIVIGKAKAIVQQMREQTERLRKMSNPVVREMTLPETVRVSEALEACIAIYSEALAAANAPLPDDFWEKANSQKPGAFEPTDSFLDEMKTGATDGVLS